MSSEKLAFVTLSPRVGFVYMYVCAGGGGLLFWTRWSWKHYNTRWGGSFYFISISLRGKLTARTDLWAASSKPVLSWVFLHGAHFQFGGEHKELEHKDMSFGRSVTNTVVCSWRGGLFQGSCWCPGSSIREAEPFEKSPGHGVARLCLGGESHPQQTPTLLAFWSWTAKLPRLREAPVVY